MKIFVSEYVCGGAWPEETIPPSLCREGRAMLEAVAADLAALPGHQVVTTWDSRLGETRLHEMASRLERPKSAAEERELFRAIADEAEMVLLIAPEFDGILADRCRVVETLGTPLANCPSHVVALTSDKLALAKHFESCGIKTISTNTLSAPIPWEDCVIKRRDGAGSLDMIRSDDPSNIAELRRTRDAEKWIVQPFIEGRTLSVAAIFHQGEFMASFPVGEQRLSRDDRFTYLGGTIPALAVSQHSINQLLAQIAKCLEEIHGYVGVDLILNDSGELVVVEVNPRLTTSYLGYRRLARENLSRWLMNPAMSCAPRFAGRVSFTADGTILEYRE